MSSTIASLRLAKVKPVEVCPPPTTLDIVTTREGLETKKHMDTEIDTFFGGASLVKPRPVALPVSKASSFDDSKRPIDALPPAYTPSGVEEALPEYQEPNTLPRQLFFYGFFFMPLWFIGTSFLVSKLKPTDDWAADKTPDEQEKFLSIIRRSEIKWAKRCLFAALAFILVLVAVLCIVRFYVMRPGA